MGTERHVEPGDSEPFDVAETRSGLVGSYANCTSSDSDQAVMR